MEIVKTNPRAKKVDYSAFDSESEGSDDDFVGASKSPAVSEHDQPQSRPTKFNKLKLASSKSSIKANKENFTKLKSTEPHLSLKATPPPAEVDLTIPEPDLTIHGLSSQETALASSCDCISSQELSEEESSASSVIAASTVQIVDESIVETSIICGDQPKPPAHQICSNSQTEYRVDLEVEKREGPVPIVTDSLNLGTAPIPNIVTEQSRPCEIIPIMKCSPVDSQSSKQHIPVKCDKMVKENKELPAIITRQVLKSSGPKEKKPRTDSEEEEDESRQIRSALGQKKKRRLDHENQKAGITSPTAEISPEKLPSCTVLLEKLARKKSVPKKETTQPQAVKKPALLKKSKDPAVETQIAALTVSSPEERPGLVSPLHQKAKPKEETTLPRLSATPTPQAPKKRDSPPVPSPAVRPAVQLPVKKAPAWKPPGKAGSSSPIIVSPVPAIGLRLGLSRNRRATKPLHPDVKLK